MCKDELKEYLEQKIAYYKKKLQYYTSVEFNDLHIICCNVRISCYEDIISTLENKNENK